MKILIIPAMLCTLILWGTNAEAFGGCEENCTDCHALEKAEASEILSKLNLPDPEISHIKVSPLKGLWEVAIMNSGKQGLIYIGFDKKHIVAGPVYEIEALSEQIRKGIGMKEQSESYVDASSIPLEDALVLGSRDAPHKVAVFTDPDCSFCGKLHEELKQVVEERKDIAFYLKLFPLRFHKEAYWKSQTIFCSGSLQYLEDNFAKRPIPRPDCETDVIDRNIELGRSLGITGTPTLIMPDGLMVKGLKDAGAIIALVEKTSGKGENK